MRKKLLEQLPIAKQELNKKRNTYSLYAYVEDVGGDKVLIIDCYYSMNNTLSYRLFLTKTDYISLDIIGNDKSKWKTGGIESVLGYRYYYGSEGRKVIPGNKKTEDVVDEFFKSVNLEYQGNAIDKIRRHQECIRKLRLIKRDKKITDPIDERMAMVPELPDDFDKWVKDEALYKSRYIFYEYSKKKKTKGYCTRCKKWVEVSGARHNEKGVCLNCNSDITYKALYKQNYIDDEVSPMIIQKVNNMLLIRRFRATRRFNRTDNIQQPYKENEACYETHRSFFDSIGFQKDIYYWGYFKQRELKWCESDYLYNEKGILYSNNLDEILNNTIYQYSGLKSMAESHHGYEFKVISFIETYPSERYFEYLIKYKLCNIVKDLLSLNYYHTYYDYCYRNHSDNSNGIINAKGKNIAELLNIQKYDLSFLQAADANLTGLRFLQYCRSNGIKPVKELIEYVQDNFRWNMEEITYFTKYTTVYKAVKYIDNIKNVGNKSQRARLWKDYIEMCIRLKYDLTNDFVLFPKDLKQRHDQCVNAINEIKNEKKMKEANKNNKEIKMMHSELVRKYSFENDSLVIMVPKDAADIVKEGHNLHHCVGSYVDRVSKRETIILFVRQKSNPEESYYTMEVKNGMVIQVRGKNNISMTPNVQGFVESFKAKVLNVNLVKEAV